MPQTAIDLFPVLLIVVLLTTLAGVVAVVHFVRLQLDSKLMPGGIPDSMALPDSILGEEGLRPSALRRADCWLAIKHSDLDVIQQALALHNSKPCTLMEGWLGQGRRTLFLSPPISGWVLVMGEALPNPAEDVDVCFRFLLELSRKLGQVQFFQANTVLNQHAWVKVFDGTVIRAYAWAGQTHWNQGLKTEAEFALNLRTHGYGDSEGNASLLSAAGSSTEAEKIHLLAARWSLDPDSIDDRLWLREWGIVGEPSRPF